MLKITPNELSGEVKAIGSKSFAHRALIAAALFSSGKVEISGVTESEDVQATARCLNAIGARVTSEDGKFVVEPISVPPESVVLDCGESGSTLRFFMPIVAALGVKTEFVGHGRLMSRPNDELIKTLASGGVTTDGRSLCGKLERKDYEINASVSSQYVSGTLFALAVLGGGRLRLTGEIASREYLKITESVLSDFGVTASFQGGEYVVTTSGKTSRKSYEVEGDWSNSAFFLAAGALSKSGVAVDGLKADSAQGDKVILDVLRAFGADVDVRAGGVTVRRREAKAFKFDASGAPDAVPIMSVLAAYADGESEIRGVERLRIKESDRLGEIIKTLTAAGVEAKYDGALKITGGKPRGGAFESAGDHRMAMSAAVLAAYADGESTISGESAVRKSYPDFWKDYESAGGLAREV